MKNSIMLLSIAVTVLCGWLLVQKDRQVAEIRSRLAMAEEARAASATRAEREEKHTKNLQKRLHQTWLEAQAKSPVVEATVRTNRTVSNIFRDAMMKEALQAEAKLAVSKTVRKLFDAGMAARLQLNDDQSAALRQLLSQRTSILWEKMMVPMAAGDIDPATMASTGQAIKQEIDQNAAQIKDMLGTDGYNTWQWFEQTQPMRDDATEFGAFANKTGQDLSPDQQSQLVDLMTSERAGFNFQYDIGDPSKLDFNNWLNNFTDEKLNAYQEDMQQLNSRIVQQAQGVLTADQSTALNQFLAQRLLQSMVTVRGTQALMAGNAP